MIEKTLLVFCADVVAMAVRRRQKKVLFGGNITLDRGASK